MSGASAIEWTDATWNPVTGCSKVSPGCAHCYAEAVTLRFAPAWGVPRLPWTPENAAANVVLRPARLEQPLRWSRPRRIFVNSMSDLFHDAVPADYIAAVFAVMALAPQHRFQVLTKRPDRARCLLTEPAFELLVRSHALGNERGPLGAHEALETPAAARARRALKFFDVGRPLVLPLPNVWLGVSIENRRYVGRADVLRATPAAVRFISAEPLLGPLVPSSNPYLMQAVGHADRYPAPGEGLDLTGIDWLIVGGESGPKHRPLRPAWVSDLRDACLEQGLGHLRPDPAGRTAFFFKQWGGRTPKAGGRELDGRTWDELPSRVKAAPS